MPFQPSRLPRREKSPRDSRALNRRALAFDVHSQLALGVNPHQRIVAGVREVEMKGQPGQRGFAFRPILEPHLRRMAAQTLRQQLAERGARRDKARTVQRRDIPIGAREFRLREPRAPPGVLRVVQVEPHQLQHAGHDPIYTVQTCPALAASFSPAWPPAVSRAPPLAAQLAPRQTPARTLDPSPLAPYVDALPRLTSALRTAGNTYRLTMREFAWRVHRDLPPTRGWGYDGQFPGPLIEARCGEAFSVEWVNRLPSRHFLPIDHTIHGAERGVPEVRAVVHLHGARVPPDSDGYPTAWYLPGDSRTCHYPNRQEAALLFYHDHAMGINRLNVYAGLAGLCALHDPAAEFGLPEGEFEVPIALCDRLLTPAAQLYYPMSDDPARPWVPELFGNLVLLNGKLWPEFAAAPRAYRFRFANIANSRFFHLSLSNRHPLRVIGADQGLLAHPAEVDALLLAPAE